MTPSFFAERLIEFSTHFKLNCVLCEIAKFDCPVQRHLMIKCSDGDSILEILCFEIITLIPFLCAVSI